MAILPLNVYIDDSSNLLDASTCADLSTDTRWAALAAYIIPSQATDLLRRKHSEVLQVFGVMGEVKASHLAGHRNHSRETDHLRHLDSTDLNRLLYDLASVFASIDGATSIAVVTQRRLIYNPEWLKRRRAGTAIVRGGIPAERVLPERVFEACYQDLLQRIAKHAEEVGGQVAQVILDGNDYLEKCRRLPSIHHKLVQTDYSIGQPLSSLPEAAAREPSDLHIGIQGADLVAYAAAKWIVGRFPPWAGRLAEIVRNRNDRYDQYGLIGVPRTCRLSYDQCNRIIHDAARSARRS